ncbi:GIY-YIG nuclease family protein [Roseivirga pacifica]|jgi:putative endonuclease|uniref:GIY-YIG nuclease family protein n=1 Tax=Roseivirga pacifica TaxID=1267423 RepID=UPI003BAD269A
MKKTFYIYITTNPNRTVLYVGRTDNLILRISEHYLKRGTSETFAGKYYCYNLLYYEETPYVLNAIEREAQLKKWTRIKKVKLIESINPNWLFLNAELMDWPPRDAFHREDFYKD